MRTPTRPCRMTARVSCALVHPAVVVSLMLCLALASRCIGAQTWPEWAELGLQWRIGAFPPRADQAYVRIQDFSEFSMIPPEHAGHQVVDSSGAETPSVVWTNPKGGTELWFRARPGQQYRSVWGAFSATREVVATSVGSLLGDDHGVEEDGAYRLDESRPAGWNEGLPLVAATAGELQWPTTWARASHVVRQTGSGKNVFVVSQGRFGDVRVSLRVHPRRARLVGLVVRVDDPAWVDRTGLYWLVASSPTEGAVGENATWGVVHDGTPGPLLKAGEWNTIAAELRGRDVRFFIGSSLAKAITLPPDAAAEGHVALATYGGMAEFDDLRVTSLDALDTVLLEDAFAGTGPLDEAKWRDAHGVPSGGLFRVVNVGQTPLSCGFSLAFHRDPWSLRGTFDGGPVPVGRSTPWAFLPKLKALQPITVFVRASGRNAPEQKGRVEFASAPSSDAVLRAFPLGAANPVAVECARAAFTGAAQLRTDAEIGRATLDQVKVMTFKGRVPERFPTGYPAGHEFNFQAGRLLGFNAVHGHAGSVNRERFERLGFRYVYTYTHWLSQFNVGGGGYRREKNDEHARQFVEKWRQTGLLDRIYYVSVRDEAAQDIGSWLKGNPLAGTSGDPDAWNQIIRYGGVRPEDLIHPDNPPPEGLDPMSAEYWKHVTGWKVEDREQAPLGVYNSMRALQSCWPCRFGNFRESLRKASDGRLRTVANIHVSAYVRDNLSGIDPWMNYSQLRTLDVPQSCDYWVGWPQQEEFLIDLQRCAARPHNEPGVDAMLQAQASYMPRSARSLKLRGMSAIGAGARSLNFYQWGPRYAATENWYDTDPDRLRVIGEINHAVGWIEDILLAGGPPLGDVAILYSKSSELWDRLAPAEGIESPATYLTERRVLYHLLRSLHRQVDMINDEVLPAEQGIDINRYKCIFMAQRCISGKGADLLLDWVEQGGTLIGLVSCGQLDELERPWPRMLDAFGLESIAVEALTDPETRDVAGTGVKVRKLAATVKVRDAHVRQRFAHGSPAVTERELGSGRLIYAAWAPGFAYHLGAHMTNDVLLGMQAAVRPIVSKWLGPAGVPACETDNPLVSARLIEGSAGRAVVLVNSTGDGHLEKVRVMIRRPGIRQVQSLEGGPLQPTRDGGDTVLTLPMGLTDILRVN